MTTLAASWQSAKVVRTREKVSFFFGVMTLLMSALMFGMTPQYVMFFQMKTDPDAPQMDTHCIHYSRMLPTSTALLSIQETRVALFPLRLVLLRHNPQLHLHLVLAIESGSFRCMLLSVPRLISECGHYMEK